MTGSAGGAVDLAALHNKRIPTLAELEASLGLRCPGCDRRIEGGFEYMWVETLAHPQLGLTPAVIQKLSCDDPECPAVQEFTAKAWARSPKTVEWLPSAPENSAPSSASQENGEDPNG